MPREELAANNFDALRLLFAVAVIFGHAFDLARKGLVDPLFAFSGGQVTFGMISVAGFFGISGYLIALSADRSRSSIEFLRRRAARIYPGFIVAMATCAFLFAPIGRGEWATYPWLESMGKWVVQSLALNKWTDPLAFPRNPQTGHVNGSLWTIKYEFACYLLMLAFALLGGLRSRWALGVAATVAFALHVASAAGLLALPAFTLGVWEILPADAFRWTAAFLIGSVAWRFRDRVRYRGPTAVGVVALLVIGTRIPWLPVVACLLPLAVPYVTFTLGFARCRPTANLATRLGGDYSYGIYLYAFPIQQCVTLAFGGDLHPLLNFAIALPLSVLAGIASWHLVERHFIRRDRREAKATIVPSAT